MTISKKEIIDILETLPPEFDSEEVMYRLFTYEKLKTAEYDLADNNLIPNSEIINMVNQWLNK